MNKYVSMIASIVLALIAGCADDFDPPSLVNKLRVLAVQADKPFALPGQPVHLEALAYDPDARTIQWAWGTCREANSNNAVDCLRQLEFTALRIADEASFDLEIPQTTDSYVGVVVVACPGTLRQGVTDTIPIACVDGDRQLGLEEFEVGMKRIFVRDPNLNHNPEIQSVSWNKVAWTAPVNAECAKLEAGKCTKYAEHEIRLQVDGASEASVDRDGLPIREQSVVQFYATGGEFEEPVKLAEDPVTKWHAKPEDTGKTITFWFVVRDDRGGVSWTERTMQIP